MYIYYTQILWHPKTEIVDHGDEVASVNINPVPKDDPTTALGIHIIRRTPIMVPISWNFLDSFVEVSSSGLTTVMLQGSSTMLPWSTDTAYRFSRVLHVSCFFPTNTEIWRILRISDDSLNTMNSPKFSQSGQIITLVLDVGGLVYVSSVGSNYYSPPPPPLPPTTSPIQQGFGLNDQRVVLRGKSNMCNRWRSKSVLSAMPRLKCPHLRSSWYY